MTKLAIDIDGVPDLNRALREFDGATDEMKGVHLEAAQLVEREAEKRAPVGKTRRLRNSIRSSAQAKSGVVRTGNARVPYGAPIHWGWRKRNIRPQPFIYEARDQVQPEVVALYEKGVHQLAKKHDLI